MNPLFAGSHRLLFSAWILLIIGVGQCRSDGADATPALDLSTPKLAGEAYICATFNGDLPTLRACTVCDAGWDKEIEAAAQAAQAKTDLCKAAQAKYGDAGKELFPIPKYVVEPDPNGQYDITGDSATYTDGQTYWYYKRAQGKWKIYLADDLKPLSANDFPLCGVKADREIKTHVRQRQIFAAIADKISNGKFKTADEADDALAAALDAPQSPPDLSTPQGANDEYDRAQNRADLAGLRAITICEGDWDKVLAATAAASQTRIDMCRAARTKFRGAAKDIFWISTWPIAEDPHCEFVVTGNEAIYQQRGPRGMRLHEFRQVDGKWKVYLAFGHTPNYSDGEIKVQECHARIYNSIAEKIKRGEFKTAGEADAARQKAESEPLQLK